MLPYDKLEKIAYGGDYNPEQWDEVVVPNALSEYFEEDFTMFQGISLDYRRFNSDSILDCYRLEYDAIKRVQPDASITTNLMFFKRIRQRC